MLFLSIPTNQVGYVYLHKIYKHFNKQLYTSKDNYSTSTKIVKLEILQQYRLDF